MLNTSTTTASNPPPPILFGKKGDIPLKRKRGGQPGNCNAFAHGLYSSYSPHPQASLFKTIVPRVNGSKIKEGHNALIPGLEKTLAEYNDLTLQVYDAYKSAKSLRESLAWTHYLGRIMGVCNKLDFALLKLGVPPVHLLGLARYASSLVQREFKELGIREWLIFVPQELNNFHANLGSGGSILTDHQWLLIREAFDTLQQDLYHFRKYKSHKPRPAPRLLFEAILIKLAFGLSWQDLPTAFSVHHPKFTPFPLRACQRLYRDLYNSGRLQAIYKKLHWHLHVYGEVTLQELVEQGCFTFDNKRISLALGTKMNWHLFTALLLLQRACHNLRTLQREQVIDRRLQGRYLRLSGPHLRQKRHPGPPTPSPIPNINDVVDFEPLERSPAHKKFQKLALREREIAKRLQSPKSCDPHSPPVQEQPDE